MPELPKRWCSQCRKAHRGDERCGQKQYERERGSASARGYGHRWRKAARLFLMRNALCIHCEADGRVGAATVVDHIIPHKGDRKLFWDQGNWQPLCKHHHDRKTATEDGGFGERGRA